MDSSRGRQPGLCGQIPAAFTAGAQDGSDQRNVGKSLLHIMVVSFSIAVMRALTPDQ